MVNINFTIFVETGLFLIFVALMYAYVLRPLLGVVDEREDRMREDEELANRRAVEAVDLERSYFRELSELHQQASQRIVDGKREAKRLHDAEIMQKKVEGAAQLAILLKELRGEIREQRTVAEPSVQAIKESLAEKFGVGASSS